MNYQKVRITKPQRRWKVGDLVRWTATDPGDAADCDGEIIEVGYCACRIQWEDGTAGIIHFDDMRKISQRRGMLRTGGT